MIKDGRKLYQHLEADIEPNWFLVLLLMLKDHPLMSITEIAECAEVFTPLRSRYREQTHPEKTMSVAFGDKADKRRRRLKLSQAGSCKKSIEMQPIWEAGSRGVIGPSSQVS